jgi:hypothetical protein
MPKSPQYKYTVYHPDGTEETKVCSKMSLAELQTTVGGLIEIVPKPYYKHQKWGRCTVYVNEEGHFEKQAERNPFFKDLGDGFYIVGKAVKEEVYNG